MYVTIFQDCATMEKLIIVIIKLWQKYLDKQYVNLFTNKYMFIPAKDQFSIKNSNTMLLNLVPGM